MICISIRLFANNPLKEGYIRVSSFMSELRKSVARFSVFVVL
jgi:hypothetical protein